MYMIYALQDNCILEDNNCVGAKRNTHSGERLITNNEC